VIHEHEDVEVIPGGVYRLELAGGLLRLASDSVAGRIRPRPTTKSYFD
jgi:hypothetical protein